MCIITTLSESRAETFFLETSTLLKFTYNPNSTFMHSFTSAIVLHRAICNNLSFIVRPILSHSNIKQQIPHTSYAGFVIIYLLLYSPKIPHNSVSGLLYYGFSYVLFNIGADCPRVLTTILQNIFHIIVTYHPSF